jgi:hypothetical protein
VKVCHDTETDLPASVVDASGFRFVVNVKFRAVADVILDAVEPASERGTVELDPCAEREEPRKDCNDAGARLLAAGRGPALRVAGRGHGEVCAERWRMTPRPKLAGVTITASGPASGRVRHGRRGKPERNERSDQK